MLICEERLSVGNANLSGMLVCQEHLSVRNVCLSGMLVCQEPMSVRNPSVSGTQVCQECKCVRNACLSGTLKFISILIRTKVRGIQLLQFYSPSFFQADKHLDSNPQSHAL